MCHSVIKQTTDQNRVRSRTIETFSSIFYIFKAFCFSSIQIRLKFMVFILQVAVFSLYCKYNTSYAMVFLYVFLKIGWKIHYVQIPLVISFSAKHVFPINLENFLISFLVEVPIISVFITPTFFINKVFVVQSKNIYKRNS